MKNVSHIPRKELDLFSEKDLEFIFNQEKLTEFIGLPFNLENFNAQIKAKEKNYTGNHRKVLSQVLAENYRTRNNNVESLHQIKRLEDSNTYTVTTGHQLCLLGGPMYFFLKIIHVIKLSCVLNEKYPDKHFIPLFWMASEDHDSAEADNINLFNKTIRWDHQQEGAVGRFQNQNTNVVFKEILALFNASQHAELKEIFKTFNGATYGEAFMNWLHELFADKGLIIVDGDQKELKMLFSPVITSELTTGFSNTCIQKTNEKLVAEKRKIQVHSREINLFFLQGNKRIRIIKNDKHFDIGEKTFALTELLSMLNESPEQFSPNAMLRPVYQECILPNLCYVGGMAELNYWAQLKDVFQECEIAYPLLQFRSNLLWIDQGMSKKLNKAGIQAIDLFKNTSEIKNKFLNQVDPNPINDDKINKGLRSIEDSLKEAVVDDKGLHQWLGSELNKIEKSLDSVKNKILNERKKSFELELNRIEKLKKSLFPDNQLQERHQNLLHFCNQNGYRQILNDMFMAIDPLNNDFTIITEENDSK